jgi:hypothetical protein
VEGRDKKMTAKERWPLPNYSFYTTGIELILFYDGNPPVYV